MKSLDPSSALGLILLLVVLGAGATAGVTLAGGVIGQSVTTVNQAVTVMGDNFSSADVGVNEAVVTVGDQGAKFAVGAEAYQGDSYGIEVPVENHADGSVTVELVLAQVSGPEPVSIDVNPTGDNEDLKKDEKDECEIKHVVQVKQDTWRLKLAPECTDRVEIDISIDSSAKPGFYKVSGVLKPLEGIE